MLVFCAHGIGLAHKKMHAWCNCVQVTSKFAHIFFSRGKTTAGVSQFHLVYNVLLMLQCPYKFKQNITQNNDVACNLIIRYV